MKTVNQYKTYYELYFRYRNIFTDILMLGLSVVMMAAFANIRIPLWPVPITMQTFGVFLVAFFFGSKKGLVSMFAYVLAGIAGLGVFAGYKAGMATLLGPTGGYILGFLAAVFVVGYMIEKGYGRTKKSVFKCMVIGNLIIYAFGLMGLKIFLGSITLWKLLMAGMIPFLIGDLIKIGAAVALFPYLWKGSEKLGC